MNETNGELHHSESVRIEESTQDPSEEPQHDQSKGISMLKKCYGPFLLDEYPPLAADAALSQKILRSFLCPPHGSIGGFLTAVLMGATLWATVLLIFREAALPGSQGFAFLSLLTTSLAGGIFFGLVQLPPPLGALVVGLAWRNLSLTDTVDMGSQISSRTSFISRNTALAVVFLQAGLGLNPEVIRRKWTVALRLGIVPCALEALTWSSTACLIMQIPWTWAFLMGCAVSAASSAVIIPVMLRFQQMGLGTEKGIPSITVAAATADSVFILVLYGVLNGVVFSEGNPWSNLVHVPVQITVGVVFGLFWGLLLRYFPNSRMEKGYVLVGRIALTLGGGLLAIFGGHSLSYAGSGPLACLILAFTGSAKWRDANGWGNTRPNPVSEFLNGCWIFLEPLLFGLIGWHISIKDFNGLVMGYGILCMTIAVVVRMLAAVLSMKVSNFKWNEAFFLALTWLPKAAIQAALGPLVYDTASRLKPGSELEDFGHAVSSLALVSILITAPIGALAMKFSAPYLLKRNT